MTNAEMTADITIDFVNQRNGNRPPSIKGNDGNYYTISDSALPVMQPHEKQFGQMTFYTNQRGYRVATAWNGQQLPKDQRNGGQAPQAQYQAPAPQPAPQAAPQAAPRAAKTDIPPGICGILKSCIETGLTREEAAGWVALGLKGKDALQQPMPPATPQQADPATNGAGGELNDEIPF